MKRIDCTNYKLSKKFYGGSEKKIGILIKGDPYILKFQKITPLNKRNNDVCEYIGSKVFQLVGLNGQEVALGNYNGERVVVMKDFTNKEYNFVPFNDVGESTIETDKEKYQYSYEDIIYLLKSNNRLINVDLTISTFFDMYIIDALLGNVDRHGYNWGFLKKGKRYFLAPIFDNGSSLFPNVTSNDLMEEIMNDEEELGKRTFLFPTSQIKLNDKKSSYYEVISSLKYEEINQSLKRMYSRININEINSMIDDVEDLNEIEKKFYKTIINYRYEKIIKSSYERLMKENEKL